MTAADLEWLIALDRRTPGSPHWPERVYESLLTAEVSPGALRYCACIAEQDGIQAGVVIARLLLDGVENACDLEWIAVEEAFRRRGIASRLLEALERWAVSLGARSILLEVRAGNEPAKALYRNAGFCQVGLRRGYYLDPEEDAVRMTRELAAVENLAEKSIEHDHREC